MRMKFTKTQKTLMQQAIGNLLGRAFLALQEKVSANSWEKDQDIYLENIGTSIGTDGIDHINLKLIYAVVDKPNCPDENLRNSGDLYLFVRAIDEDYNLNYLQDVGPYVDNTNKKSALQSLVDAYDYYLEELNKL